MTQSMPNAEESCSKVLPRSYLVEFLIPPLFRLLLDEELRVLICIWMASRWRVHSLLQGDSLDDWRDEPFQMMLSGPLWFPPHI